jgi:hypothetical protein
MTSWNRNCRSKIRWDWERKIVARTDRHSSFEDHLAKLLSGLIEDDLITEQSV